MADSKIKINVQVSENKVFEVEIAKNATVKDLKQLSTSEAGCAVEEMKLISKGRILKDE